MEWKWMKNFLIVVFIILNCFLVYKVYERNQFNVINEESITSINTILGKRNITCSFDFSKVETKGYMKKIRIANKYNIEPSFIEIGELNEEKELYIGRNRKILSLPIIITNFLRDTKIENANLKDIILGYYPEMSQIDNTVLSGEAIPAWRIVLEDGSEYIYNAYLGEKMSMKFNEIKE